MSVCILLAEYAFFYFPLHLYNNIPLINEKYEEALKANVRMSLSFLFIAILYIAFISLVFMKNRIFNKNF